LEEYDRASAALSGVAHGRKTIEPHLPALLMMGDMAFRSGDWNGAVQYFEDYLSFGDDQPSADDARLNRALALSRSGRDDEALRALEELTGRGQSNRNSAQAWFERGQVQLRRNDTDGAKASFERAVQIDPKSTLTVHAINHLGALAARQGRSEEAAQRYAQVAKASDNPSIAATATFQQGQAEMAAGKLEDAAATLEQFLSRWPEHAQARIAAVQRAIALARLDRHADALVAMDKVDTLSLASIDPALRITMLYEQAWCLRETDRTEGATRTYDRLLAEQTYHDLKRPAALELAQIHASAGRREQAVPLLESLAGPNAGSAIEDDVRERALLLLISCRFELGEFEKCATSAEQFTSEFPHSKSIASVHLLAGESLFKLGRHGKAADHFRMMSERFPNDAQAATCLLRLGECCAALSRWDESRLAFEAHRLRFSASDLWFQSQFGIGWALENQGELDAAISAYRAVVDGHNGATAARAQFQIGECLFAQKSHEEAVRELLKVDILYAYPEWSAAALYEAGRCLEAMARPSEARTQFEQVQQRFSESKWAALAAKRLASASAAPASGG
jgi:TolA-binding protein